MINKGLGSRPKETAPTITRLIGVFVAILYLDMVVVYVCTWGHRILNLLGRS